MRVLHLVSCRGWSSDAYWAARVSAELERRGHAVTLGCRAGTDRRVIEPARDEGVARTQTFAFAGGLAPSSDASDVRRLARALGETDVVHVHRGKEHWLAAIANRLASTRRPLVRTRHIVQAVRAHAGNRWLYRHATDLVVTVTDAIRRQLVAAGLAEPGDVVSLPGGVDAELYRPGPADAEARRRLGCADDTPLIGMISGFRLMKGHALVVAAAAVVPDARLVFVGRGPFEMPTREAVFRRRLEERVTIAGFVDDLPATMRALDVGLYVPLESEGMSRVVFEYLAAGCPLIATRVGVVPEVLVDGEHALLVPAGDVPSLAEAIARLARDAGLRERLARSGRALVEDRYSGARIAAALEAHYERLCAARPASRAA